MKNILTLVMISAVLTVAVADIAPPQRSGTCITGVWEFVHADGSITNGSWSHENVLNIHLVSHEPDHYAEQTGKTGSLSVWWDQQKERPLLLQEYLNGQKNGYAMCWHPNGRLQFAGRLIRDKMASGTWWAEDGRREGEIVADGDIMFSISRGADGKLKSVEKFLAPPWKPLQEKPQQTNAPYSSPATGSKR
jgi:hypothetical protein